MLTARVLPGQRVELCRNRPEDEMVVDLRDRYVRFKICDIYLPDPQEVLRELHGNDLLQGCVVDLSDSGEQREAFAVIKVAGVERLMIVPVDHIIMD